MADSDQSEKDTFAHNLQRSSGIAMYYTLPWDVIEKYVYIGSTGKWTNSWKKKSFKSS